MKAYSDLVKHVLANGTRKENRTGVDTISTFNYNYELGFGKENLYQDPGPNYYHLGDGFPMDTTKKISWKNIAVEMLWFLSGSANISLLQKHNCKFWNPWCDEFGNLGPVYGKQWRRWEQVEVKNQLIFDAPQVAKSHWRPKLVAGVGRYKRGDRENLLFGDFLYNTWAEMLYRCYDEKRDHYKWYGAQGVHVDPRWFDFRTFVEDVQKIPNWHLKRSFPKRYSLDKDIMNSNRYGPETCIWASIKEQKLNTTKTKLVKAIRPDGKILSTLDVGSLCDDYNLDRSSIHKCLRGEKEQHNGWRFSEVKIPEGSLARVRVFDQIENALALLKVSPMSRRMVVTAWNPSEFHLMALPPCHMIFAFNVQLDQDGEQRLCLHLTQRSCDVALGVPYNIASYALLLMLFSHMTGIKPGIFAHTLLDAHIYTGKPDGSMAEYDHIPGLQEQILRKPKDLPKLIIDPSIKELSDIEELMAPEVSTQDILDKLKLEGYDPHPTIKFKVAV